MKYSSSISGKRLWILTISLTDISLAKIILRTQDSYQNLIQLSDTVDACTDKCFAIFGHILFAKYKTQVSAIINQSGLTFDKNFKCFSRLFINH